MLGIARDGPLGGTGSLAVPDLAPDLLPGTGATGGGTGDGARREPPSDAERAAEQDAWAVLAAISGLGPVAFGALLGRFGSGRAILAAAAGRGTTGLIITGEGRRVVGEDLAARIGEAARSAERTLDLIRRAGLAVITLEDPAYPRRLLEIEMPPHVLFVRGDRGALAADRAVAVVGTRRPSELGRRLAGRISGAIARAGACVVSGLAVGIDGCAHAAAVAERAPTVAVLGGGHERLFPRAHRRLAESIVATGGAVVSELPPEATPTRGTFPRRNRLVSGLSEATVVVEAPHRSGALITAGWALEQGRGCYIVPGPLDAPAAGGGLAFLRAYPGEARVVAGIPELLEDLDLVAASPAAGGRRQGPPRAVGRASAAAALAELGSAERAVARALVAGRATADQLQAATGLPIATVLGTLTLLEIRGLAVSAYGRSRPAGLLATTDPADLPAAG